MNRIAGLACAGLFVFILGCGSEAPYRKPTSPVTGKITVDGTPPGLAIQIQCHPSGGMDATHPSFSQTESDAEGNFKISTYDEGDGMPAGEYTLTFKMQEFNVMSRDYSGPDQLGGRYSDPATSTFKVNVTEGKPTDLGVIELKTK